MDKKYRIKYFCEWMDAELKESEYVKEKFFVVGDGEIIPYNLADEISEQE